MISRFCNLGHVVIYTYVRERINLQISMIDIWELMGKD